MGCAILRISKLKAGGDVARMSKHALREYDDPSQIPGNVDLGAPPPRVVGGAKSIKQIMNRLTYALSESPVTVRKDAPRALDILITTSHQDLVGWPRKKQDEWLHKASDWAIERFGGRSNLLTCTIHYDESTPHIQLLMLPRDEKGFFAATRLLGGRVEMRAMQEDFWKAVGEPYGLERGERGSNAIHVPISTFYGALESGDHKVPRDVPVPEEPKMLARLKPEYAEIKKARADAIAHNEAAQKRRDELARIGASMHPKGMRDQAERYRSQLDTMGKREADLVKRETALFNKELWFGAKEAKLAHKMDQWSKTMMPRAVEQLAKDLGLDLKPGRGLLDQIHKGGLAVNMIDAAGVLEKALDPDVSGLPDTQAQIDAA